MPINKYNERNLNKMRELVSIDSAIFIPKLDNIFGPDRLVKADMLQCSYGIKERLGLFPDIDYWGTSVSIYDEEKVKVYKIPSKDRLDMLVRIYKIIKGNKK